MLLTLLRSWLVLFTLCAGLHSSAQPATASAAPTPATANPLTDPAYKLLPGDVIAIAIFGEPDLAIAQKLDANGRIRLALAGDLELSGITVREAEQRIEQCYIERRLLKKPMITLSVNGYSERTVSILGAVRGPGKLPFPPEKTSLDITDIITRAGGFLPTAKSEAVRITRVDAAGKETSVELNVEAMLTRRGAGPNTPKTYLVYPGDRIWVPERLF